jgi:hypothetical protein
MKKGNVSYENEINNIQTILHTYKPFEKYQLQIKKCETDNKITEERLKEITELFNLK